MLISWRSQRELDEILLMFTQRDLKKIIGEISLRSLWESQIENLLEISSEEVYMGLYHKLTIVNTGLNLKNINLFQVYFLKNLRYTHSINDQRDSDWFLRFWLKCLFRYCSIPSRNRFSLSLIFNHKFINFFDWDTLFRFSLILH